MIAIVDYGIGNLYSVYKALERLKARPRLTDNYKDIKKARGIVLPGVGSFGEAMGQLEKKDLISSLHEAVDKDIPFLGVCLGLQLMFEKSQESPGMTGLAFFRGDVRKLPPTNKIPHMGWNDTHFLRHTILTENISSGRYFYFAHSYYVAPREEKDVVVGICNYNVTIPVIINRDLLWGLQFHPEKSSHWGMRCLSNWVEVTKG